MSGFPCPRCRQPRATPSRSKRAFDWIYRLFNRKPYRCLFCGLRFFSLDTGVWSLTRSPLKRAD